MPLLRGVCGPPVNVPGPQPRISADSISPHIWETPEMGTALANLTQSRTSPSGAPLSYPSGLQTTVGRLGLTLGLTLSFLFGPCLRPALPSHLPPHTKT